MPRTLLALLLLTLIACGEPDLELATPTIDTLPGGVVQVTNIGPTAWADTSGWTLVLERSFAPAEGAPGELANPRGIVADSRGRVFVIDRDPIGVKRFGADGAFLGSFAPEGAGPGEISGQGILMIVRDTIVVHDQAQTRTSTWTGDGQFLRVWSSQCCMQLPVLADNAGRIPVPGMVFPVPEGGDFFDGVGFVRYRTDGSVVDSVATPKVEAPSERNTWQYGDGNVILVPMQPQDVSTFGPDGSMVAGNNARFQLLVSRTGRDTLRTFTGVPLSVAIPDSARQAALDEYVTAMPGLAPVARLEDLPSTYASFSALAVDGLGNTWVMVPGPAGEGDHFQVFDPEGILLGDVAAPFRSTYRTFWTVDRVYTIVDDERSGLPEVRVYRIERDS